MTDALKLAKSDLAARLARMEAATARERELTRVSAECIRRSQELLSEPVPKTWPGTPTSPVSDRSGLV
jgi:hypothetical protein